MGYKKVLAAFYRGVLSSRYRVRLEGTGILADRRATLFLPNHQASVDPQIVCSQLLRYVDVSPLVTEGYFKIPVVAPSVAFDECGAGAGFGEESSGGEYRGGVEPGGGGRFGIGA